VSEAAAAPGRPVGGDRGGGGEGAGGRAHRPTHGTGDGSWRLAVDTGGTFTDCLAVDPEGRQQRAKVLSTAALRTRIAARLGESAVRLSPIGRGSGAGRHLPAGFFAGCALSLLGPQDGGGAGGAAGAGWRVVASGAEEPATGAALRLDRPLPPGELAGVAVELRAAEEAPVLAARLLTGTPPGRPLPPLAMRLATTRGTNALLERKGAAVALFITRGFADLLRIGTQQRPELFALAIERPAPLYRAVVEVDERLAADGSAIAPLELAALRQPAAELLAAGVRCAAVALLHSYRNPRHERELGSFLRDLGFEHVALSADLAPLIKLLPRAETAVVDAYLAPVLGGYLRAVAAALPSGALQVMTSAGGLVRAAAFCAKDSLLSGPAGGVVGAARAGRRSGFARVIAFDMGGTSTDVARYDGDFEYLFEHRVGDAFLVAPALAIETVAAGGGSICSFTDDRLRVGPESAGARPGPACYGAGGPLTLTDVNLLLGRLAPGRFEIPLDPGAAERAAAVLLASLEKGMAAEDSPGPATAAVEGSVAPERAGEAAMAEPAGYSRHPRAAAPSEPVLEGLLAIANERMAEAIRGISLRRGYDPGEYPLLAFGGAGPQHACAVAALLGMATVLVPADASLLSALGLEAAVVERFAQRQVLAPLEEVAERLDAWCAELGREAAAAVAAEGVPAAEVEVRRRIVALRFAGQESTLAVDYAGAAALAPAFAAAYRDVYGYEPEGRAIEVESLRVVASSGGAAAAAAAVAAARVAGEAGEPISAVAGEPIPATAAEPVPAAAGAPVLATPGEPVAAADPLAPGGRGAGSGIAAGPAGEAGSNRQRACLGGVWREVPAHERAALATGVVFHGPALVLEDHTTTVVEEGWSCRVDEAGALVLRRRLPG
jgi:5-oxoprolinase (ATP-hydrolysing)